jgi:hypothetical protein
MRKEGDFETNPDVIDVIYLSEDSKTKNEEEKVKKVLKSLEMKSRPVSIPESMNVHPFFLVYLLLSSLEASEANMKVSSRLNTKEKS